MRVAVKTYPWITASRSTRPSFRPWVDTETPKDASREIGSLELAVRLPLPLRSSFPIEKRGRCSWAIVWSARAIKSAMRNG